MKVQPAPVFQPGREENLQLAGEWWDSMAQEKQQPLFLSKMKGTTGRKDDFLNEPGTPGVRNGLQQEFPGGVLDCTLFCTLLADAQGHPVEAYKKYVSSAFSPVPSFLNSVRNGLTLIRPDPEIIPASASKSRRALISKFPFERMSHGAGLRYNRAVL